MEKEKLTNLISLGHSTWKIAEILNTTQPNVRYWLKKYNIQTIRTINTQNSNRICLTCMETKSQDEFYKRGKKYMSHCKKCHQKIYFLRKRQVKQQAIDYLGGKCSACGYNKCNSALDLHHKNPAEKDKNYQNYKGAFTKKYIKELDKCILLCSNCHRELHERLNISQ